jgi:hypothetical protein
MKMLKKSLIAVAVLAMCMPAFAGSLKIHGTWPCAPIAQEMPHKIDVIMDVGYYIELVNQDPIKVDQDSTSNDPYHTYTGCDSRQVKSNFNASLTVSAAATSAAGGSWGATITPSTVNAGTTTVQLCVTGTGVNIDKLVGGAKAVKVAQITVKVLPVAI